VLKDDITPERYGEWFQRYVGDYQQPWSRTSSSSASTKRAFIRFTPSTAVTWDFGKIPRT
jgi:hypothetical protein